jgi:hypothetical protein
MSDKFQQEILKFGYAAAQKLLTVQCAHSLFDGKAKIQRYANLNVDHKNGNYLLANLIVCSKLLVVLKSNMHVSNNSLYPLFDTAYSSILGVDS